MNSKIIDKYNKYVYKKPNVRNVNIDKSNFENTQNKKIIVNKRKTEYIPESIKLNSRINFINESQIKKHIKSIQANKQIKRQNLFIKNKLKEKESLNLNIDINKIINNKENSSTKQTNKLFSSITKTKENPKSKSKIENNNNIDNGLHNTNKTQYIHKKRFDSDLSNTNSNKLSKINNNISIKRTANKNKLNRLSPKSSKNFTVSNRLNNYGINLFQIHNKETKINIKTKKNNNNLIEKNINNINTKIRNNNNTKDIKVKKEQNLKNKNILNSETQTCSSKNNNNNKELFDTNKINIDVNPKIENDKNEKVINEKENLYPVKKSLFTEHMNFLINYTDDINLNKEKYKKENNFNNDYNPNYINDLFNYAQPTENKEFESKFINYDLGMTTGSSQIKNSMIAFGNEDSFKNFEISKMKNMPNVQNFLVEENERTEDELEKLAERYLNISREVANKNEKNKFQNSQINTNTITTIIDNNFNEDSI